MIDKAKVSKIVDEWLDGKDYFVVDISVSPDDKVVVEIDHAEGVWIDDCVELSSESRLNRDEEDYELEVGSAGIGQPFKIPRQYQIHIGDDVEVITSDNRKLTGTLKDANDDHFTIIIKEKIKPEGAKKTGTHGQRADFQLRRCKIYQIPIKLQLNMAKKTETVNLVDTFSEFKELKNIDRTTLVSVLEDSFRSVIAKMFGSDDNYDVIVNPDKGDFEIYRNRTVVEDGKVTNSNSEIALSEAQKIDSSYEIGEEVTDQVDFMKFGRRAILNLRQTLASRILELQKDSLYTKYSEKIGQIITAEIYQVWKKEILLLDEEGNELLLPKTEQIPSDFYRKGETAKAVVARVENKNNNPKIILSRTSPLFLQRLFELEVPEIADGLITIKKIARIPGERAKIAVESYDDRIDPVA